MTKSSIRATDVGEFIRYKSCERRFKLGFNNRELARELPFAGKLFATLDPVLKAAGRKREIEWEQYLKRLGMKELSPYKERPADKQSISWCDFASLAKDLRPNETAFIREVNVIAELEAFVISGSIDFVLLLWRRGKPQLRLVECKASRKDQTYHRAQLAVYKMITQKLLNDQHTALFVAEMPVEAAAIECVVARIDEGTNRGQAILDIPAFDLSMLEADITRLISSDGALSRILDSPLDDLSYQIEAKCDDCIFNIHCLPESARLRKPELLGCDASSVRALKRAAINSLDELAAVELSTDKAAELARAGNLSSSLDLLKAKAFARLSTLPDKPDKCYPVQFLSYRIFSQLPEHDILGHRLIRVYVSVDYDYTENRIAALSAHITASDGMLHTAWSDDENAGKRRPRPTVIERVVPSDGLAGGGDRDSEGDGDGDGGSDNLDERALAGIDCISLRDSAWTGFYEWDNESERKLIEDFFESVVAAIRETAGKRNHAPLHFYFWSRAEVAKLIEACSRSSSALLGHLQELLGCRESLEQLIYSCVQDEINNRYGLGWTGRGLLVASSLSWFGVTYHWTRLVNGVATRLDQELAQDLFDFKADLYYANSSWKKEGGDKSQTHRFEIRSQFNDTLPAGYLHAYWGVLPEAETNERNNSKRALETFRNAAKPDLLKEYLKARVHALRWLEERVEFKSSALLKPPVFLSELPKFSLKVNQPESAAIDFLRLDFHIRFTDWLASHLIAPQERVFKGWTLPLKNICAKDGKVYAEINAAAVGLSKEELQARCRFEPKDFIRLSPCQEDLLIPQTLAQFGRAGITCTIDELNWNTGKLELSSISLREADRYRLSSRYVDKDSQIFDYATIDENPSDFVSGRVEKRLAAKMGKHVYAWFDRTKPQIPEAKQLGELAKHPLKKLVKSFQPGGEGTSLAHDQINAVLNGLESTVQLLQGPPGTGKTMTTAVATFVRILAMPQKPRIVLLSANTHTAIDTLLARMAKIMEPLKEQALKCELEWTEMSLYKAESAPAPGTAGAITKIKANANGLAQLAEAKSRGVVILGGTTGTLLKLADLDKEFRGELLILDEASMMVFPHFLALATLVRETGSIMLAGDHRQLSPILSHDWDREDRPPTVLYQPYASAYEAIRSLRPQVSEQQLRMDALQVTFRLPDEIRKLIARIYRLDDVDLHSPRSIQVREEQRIYEKKDKVNSIDYENSLKSVWSGANGLFLVAHTEHDSRQSNQLEVNIIKEILSCAEDIADGSVAIVTPHRAQRTLLQKQLKEFGKEVDLIDTVERLQGGERPVVIFSATVSDPAAIASNVEFILDLNRSNVAFSRAKQRLIVICSEELLNFIPSSLEQYDETLLWKSLREVCSRKVADLSFDSHTVRIFC